MKDLGFIEDMEARFGSDEALGVWFETADGTRYSPAELDALLQGCPEQEAPDTESFLPGGGSACCCTDYACHIFCSLPGRVQVFGFANQDNPTSRVAREQIHPGGHDFAVVDGRYVVDPWLRLVSGCLEQMVFDMECPLDTALVADIYGPKECWMRMWEAEAYALAR